MCPGRRRRAAGTSARSPPSPRAARDSRGLLLDAGFVEVAVEVRTGVFTEATMWPMLDGLATAARTAGAISPEEATAWTTDQTERARNSRLFVALSMFVTSGTAVAPATAVRG